MVTSSGQIALLAVLGALLIAAPAAAAPTTIDTLPRASGLDAGQGAVVWSRYDETAHAYRLVVRRNGVNTLPAIDTSPVPIDADLGSDARRHSAVVYSRCASYKHDRDPRDGCDLYVLSLATGAERKIGAASSAASEHSPTLWHLNWRGSPSARPLARPCITAR